MPRQDTKSKTYTITFTASEDEEAECKGRIAKSGDMLRRIYRVSQKSFAFCFVDIYSIVITTLHFLITSLEE